MQSLAASVGNRTFGAHLARTDPAVQRSTGSDVVQRNCGQIKVPAGGAPPNKYATFDPSGMTLYRGSSSRAPNDVLANGFDKTTGTHGSIIVHLLNNGVGSKWVSTSSDREVGEGYAGVGGFNYMIAGVTQPALLGNTAYANHWTNRDETHDLQAITNGRTTAKATYPFPHQAEVSVWQQVTGANVVGIGAYVDGQWKYTNTYAWRTNPELRDKWTNR
jgi:hypothetical protein